MSTSVKNNSIGKKLNNRRLELGYSVKKVAAQIGISESTYRDWENGRKISGEPYSKIAEALSMPILGLLSEQEIRVSSIEKEIKSLKECVNNIEKLIIPFI